MPTYIVDGNPIDLTLDPDFIAVRFNTDRHSLMARAIDETAAVGDYQNRIDLPEFGLTLIPTAPSPTEGARSANAVRSLSSASSVSQAGFVFQRGNTKIIPTGQILMAFVADTDEATYQQTFSDYQLNPIEKTKFGEITVELNDPEANVFEVAQQLSALDQVAFAEPDFITITPRRYYRALPPRGAVSGFPTGIAATTVQPLAIGPDPLSSQQYYLNLIQAVAAAEEARPSREITVAILDEGVDSTHPDLTNLDRQYDGTDNDEFQEPKPTDAHGTACAGIVGATANNLLGIRGVAAGCSMHAIRIAFSDNSGEYWVTTNEWIARSIDWAWENGADVLSNSWGGGTPSNLIINAFNRARAQGRNGKGAVVVVAAGNSDIPVDFPGNLDGLLTVAASNQDDEPKTKSSSDREWWWGSNYGPEVDVAAPGVQIATTDISGDRGYNRSGNLENYVLDFNGTSSACPQVAGVCALVLSRNPDLTEAEVRAIVRETADKVGSVVYDPSTGHHPRMGQGRVNALQAVRQALPQVESGTEFVRTPNLAIPDYDAQGVSDAIQISTVGIVTGIEVEVDITHTYRGDLRVSLSPPSGLPLVLHNRQGGSADNIKVIYTPANTAVLANFLQAQPKAEGTWRLSVVDLARRDTGRLNRWRLKLAVAAPSNRELKVIVPTNGAIPDNRPEGIQSEAMISVDGSVAELTVQVEITHTWCGDLEVSLRHGGVTVPLHRRQGGSQDNLFATYTMANSSLSEFRGFAAAGVWTLQVADRAARDVGKLARWSIEVMTD
jgi:subtilisin-like proprotein convertase family protein